MNKNLNLSLMKYLDKEYTYILHYSYCDILKFYNLSNNIIIIKANTDKKFCDDIIKNVKKYDELWNDMYNIYKMMYNNQLPKKFNNFVESYHLYLYTLRHKNNWKYPSDFYYEKYTYITISKTEKMNNLSTEELEIHKYETIKEYLLNKSTEEIMDIFSLKDQYVSIKIRKI